MANIFFTADTHFGHDKILLPEFCNRPYQNVEEMDEALIANWNAKVGKGDIVYHLGDFAWGRYPKDIEAYSKRLNGQIHLILGDHDHKQTQKAEGFAWIGHFKRIKVQEQHILMFHFAMRTWTAIHHGYWSLYGHSHGNLLRDWTVKAFDVGVDLWNFTPLSFDEVANQMRLHAISRTGVRPRQPGASAQS